MRHTTDKEGLNRRTFLGTAVGATAGLAVPAAGAESVKPQLPVLDSVDVLVVGGGPAGIGAALGAARRGARTLLVENCSFFGGVAAWALGMPINQVRPNGKARSAVHELLVRKLEAYGDQAVRAGKHELWCNVEYLKVAVLDALDEVGCQYLVHVRAADAVVENNRVTGVVIATKHGLMMVHDVPYRAILPKKIDGLLMAGRCISATHVAAAAGKSMGNCMATGHAAGVAAAMCAKTNVTPRELKVADLQGVLRADGVDLDMKDRDQASL